MKNLLVVSSTKNSNYELSTDIREFFAKNNDLCCSLVSLEDFDLPLYTPTKEKHFKEKESFPKDIEKVKNIFVDSDAIIWCSPEYNGGISPIVTNTLSWISRATIDWKDAFKDKNVLICTSSGGNGKNFVKSFTQQLTYLGSQVMQKSIIKTKKKDINKNEFKDILNQFCQKIL